MMTFEKARKFIGRSASDLDTPALLVDLAVYERNLHLMAKRLSRTSVSLRPHFKSHKCTAVAKDQMALGAIGITCAKLDEAEVLAASGIKSILIANQVVGKIKFERLAALSGKTEVIIGVDNLENIKDLSRAAEAAGTKINVLVEVDIGMQRCGIPPQAAVRFARAVAKEKALAFRGIMGYEGHLVFEKNARRKERETQRSLGILLAAKEKIEKAGFPVEIVSAGGTGTAHITQRIRGVTELQAGSYPFMDLKYDSFNLGFDVSVSVLAAVMSVNARGKAIIDCGRKAIPIDHGLPAVRANVGIKVLKLNEEHGHLAVPKGKRLRLGQKIRMIPGHCCTTFNAHDVAFGVRRGKVERIFNIDARGGYR